MKTNAGAGALGFGAVVAATGAVMASLCCVGPGLLAFLGVGGALVSMEWAPLRPYLLSVSLALLGAAFWRAYRPAACAARKTRAFLWTALVFTVSLGVLSSLLGSTETIASPKEDAPAFDQNMAFVCEQACAAKDYDPASVVPQEKAVPGDLTRCPVSGVVFEVKAESTIVEHEGRQFRTCCPGCAKAFEAQPERFSRNVPSE